MYLCFLTINVVVVAWFLCWETFLHEKCFVLQDKNCEEILDR